jgi:hypothetical protein
MNWFECKVSYEKMDVNGVVKKVTERYLIEGISCTDAEAQIIDYLKPYISGDFAVTGIKCTRLSGLFFCDDGDRFYGVKVFLVTLDERSGAEKKTAMQMLAKASTVRDALDVVEEGMKGTLADYEIASVGETAIMDVVRYKTLEP